MQGNVEEDHFLMNLMTFLEKAKSVGALPFVKCTLSQGGDDGSKTYNVKIPSESEMSKIMAQLQNETKAAPVVEKPVVQNPQATDSITMRSNAIRLTKVSKKTSRCLERNFPDDFLRRMGWK